MMQGTSRVRRGDADEPPRARRRLSRSARARRARGGLRV